MTTIDDALRDRALLGAALGDAKTWAVWLVVLKAAFGLAMTAKELATFASVAGDRTPPSARIRELWCIIGRRGGKSKIAAAVAIFLSMFVTHRLSKGERGLVLVLAASQDQARVVFGYAEAFLTESPVLRQEIDTITRHEIRLKNGITIAVHANSFRSVRGRTLCACIFDEVAFWRDETTATPDTEVYTAVLPALATTGGMLIAISTPYRKLGLMHTKFRDHFGVDSHEVLIVQGGSITFNPSLSDAVVAAQRAADPLAASAEWDAEFRADVDSFLDDQTIEQAIQYGRPLELPPSRANVYQAFVDPSGGRSDAYTIAIGHRVEYGESHRYIIDLVRGKHPSAGATSFDPQQTTEEFAALCRDYTIDSVIGDNFSAEWCQSAWERCGITYVRSDLPKSVIYLECLPLFTRGCVWLPDHPRLLRELRLLERHTHRSGRDTVDHGRNGHDDHANAVCGLLRDLANDSGCYLDALAS